MRIARMLLLLLGWLPLSGCGDFLTVNNPGSITDDDLENPRLLEPMMALPEIAGVERLDTFVNQLGLVSNDIMEPLTVTSALALDWGEWDILTDPFSGLYNGLAVDQWRAREGLRRMMEFLDNPNSHPAVARGYFWDAFIMVNRADAFEQITFEEDGEPGPPRSPVAVYQMALDRLADAVTVATAANEVQYLAASYGTMARAARALWMETGELAHLTLAAQHAGDALATQSDFRLEGRFSDAPGQINSIENVLGPNSGGGQQGAGATFYNWIDPVTSEVDPRIAISDAWQMGPNGPHHFQLKYPVPSSPIPASRWQEAALIIAEHRLETNELSGAVEYINLVRDAAGLASFDSDDAEEIRDQIIYERQTEFWLEGRNWQDLRFYGIFPDNWTTTGRDLGLDRRFPVSQAERETNPHFF